MRSFFCARLLDNSSKKGAEVEHIFSKGSDQIFPTRPCSVQQYHIIHISIDKQASFPFWKNRSLKNDRTPVRTPRRLWYSSTGIILVVRVRNLHSLVLVLVRSAVLRTTTKLMVAYSPYEYYTRMIRTLHVLVYLVYALLY